MENFIFYYTLFKDFDTAFKKMKEDSTFAQQFLNTAQKLCELESHTFLTEDNQVLLQTYNQALMHQIKEIEHIHHIHFSADEWRIKTGLMCTFAEWCEETGFFELDSKQQKYIFPENPVDGYFEIMQAHQK